MANGKLLYQTGSVAIGDGLEGWDTGSRGRGYMHIYVVMTNLHCCTAETNTTLKAIFAQLKKKLTITRSCYGFIRTCHV